MFASPTEELLKQWERSGSSFLCFIAQPKYTIIIFGEPSSDTIVKRNFHSKLQT